LVDKVVSQVTFEIEQIDRLFDSYAALLEKTQEGIPGLVEVTAVASVLHSFYNGLENILLCIAKGIDRDVPSGAQWHRDLLTQMVEATSFRPPVLTDETTQRLADYLAFRHFYRHSYTFFLEWEEMVNLVTPLTEVWQRVKGEIDRFLSGLDQTPRSN
jgi:hypothetical protein